MPNPQKTERVAALKERIEGSNALLLAEYRGLSVHDATELRRTLGDQARFSVVKNTLFERAASAAGVGELARLLAGPTAVAFVHGDVVSVAKKVVDAARRYPALVIKGAWLDGQVLDAEAARELATLESREVMLSRIAGMLKAEMARAAGAFQALQSRFLGLLEAYRDKLPSAAAPEPGALDVAASEVAGESSRLASTTAEQGPAPEGDAEGDERPLPSDAAPEAEVTAEVATEAEAGDAEAAEVENEPEQEG